MQIECLLLRSQEPQTEAWMRKKRTEKTLCSRVRWAVEPVLLWAPGITGQTWPLSCLSLCSHSCVLLL